MDNLLDYNFLERYLHDFELKRRDLDHLADMLAVIRSLLEEVPSEERKEILRMQGFLFDKLSDYQPSPISVPFDPLKSTWQLVCDLLDRGKKRGAEGFVALYLVEAALRSSFATIGLDTRSYGTSAVQLAQHGNLHVGDTIFYVTVSPTLAIYEECKQTLRAGLDVYLLVRSPHLARARLNVQHTVAGRISVQSIESFVSQNIDELSRFSRTGLAKRILELLELYNARVDAVETNKSMMIEIR